MGQLDSPTPAPSARRQRNVRLEFVLMGVFWTGLFVSTIAGSRLGALFLRDTLPALLVNVAMLLLALLLIPIGIGVSVVRKSWSPLLSG